VARVSRAKFLNEGVPHVSRFSRRGAFPSRSHQSHAAASGTKAGTIAPWRVEYNEARPTAAWNIGHRRSLLQR
jgi:hypothetical protein